MRFVPLLLLPWMSCSDAEPPGLRIDDDKEGVLTFHAKGVTKVVCTRWRVEKGKAEAMASWEPALNGGRGQVKVVKSDYVLPAAGDRWGGIEAGAGLAERVKGRELLLYMDGWTGATPFPRPSPINVFSVNVRNTEGTDIRFAALTIRWD